MRDIFLTSGIAEIRDDVNSEAKRLALFEGEKTSNVEGLRPLQSSNGLYVRVKKPTDKGTFKFTYGVFQKIKDPHKYEGEKPTCKYGHVTKAITCLLCYLHFGVYQDISRKNMKAIETFIALNALKKYYHNRLWENASEFQEEP